MVPRTPPPSSWFLLPLGSFAAIVAMTGLSLAVALPGATLRAADQSVAAPIELEHGVPASTPAPGDGVELPPWHPRLPSRAHPSLEDDGAGRCPFAGPGRSGRTRPPAGKRSSCPALRGDGAPGGATLL